MRPAFGEKRSTFLQMKNFCKNFFDGPEEAARRENYLRVVIAITPPMFPSPYFVVASHAL
jgi:hypothetical protein